jgi:phosphopantothenoylcysteine decarboxylase
MRDATIDGIRGKPFSAADFADDQKHHILLAASGSVATIKLPLIAQALAQHQNVSIRVILTSSATEFLQGQSAEQPQLESIEQLPNVEAIYLNKDEWAKPWVRGDKILHIELRRWAHALLIAPLSANSLAKMANGLSDNLLMSVIRAWDTTGLIDGRKKAIFVAPAMNSAMWRHPITSKHIETLKDDWGSPPDGWVRLLGPIDKGLACGDVGDGGMMEWSGIVTEVESHFGLTKPST